jgi:hypothetical protein
LIETELSWLFEHGLPVHDGVVDEPASVEMGRFLELLEVVPTTLAGVVALVTHLDHVRQKDPWKFEDNYATPLIGTLAESFKLIAAGERAIWH